MVRFALRELSLTLGQVVDTVNLKQEQIDALEKVALSEPMVQSRLQDIEDFTRKFNFPINSKPGFLAEDYMLMREGFLDEEVDEFAACARNNDLHGCLDALVDLEYVLLGTVVLMGMKNIFEAAWKRVHRANMNKVLVESADDSKRGHKYDVKKPAGWKEPTFNDLLQ